jgi:N utilization substance protein B
MGKRNTARRLAMQALYQAEMTGDDIGKTIENIFESEKFIPETRAFAENLACSAWERRKETDKIIARMSIDWPLDRIGKVDRSILRLALHEIESGETPASVVINEAIELSKKYSSEESAKYINGILGAYLRSLAPA